MRRTVGFQYEKGALHCDGTALSSLAEEHGTPLYVYSAPLMAARVRELQSGLGDAPCQIHFAVKALPNVQVLRHLAGLGCGADIVSGGELARALKARIAPGKIVFSGVGKTREEMAAALKARIARFNVESFAELMLLNDVAAGCGAQAPVSFRVNPDVDAKTHPYISTGLKENKFGLDRGELAECLATLPRLKNIDAQGLSCHIGSQILTLKPLQDSWEALKTMAAKMPFPVTHLDLGGGLGIPYGREKAVSLADYGKRVAAFSRRNPDFQLALEPGRSLVGPAGALVTRVIAVKLRGRRRFAILDAGMNDLIRPALYGATHGALPLRAPRRGAKLAAYTLVGPVCESADTFQSGARLPELTPGDLVALTNAGAYGMSMASQYNSRPRPAEVLVREGRADLVRCRETYDDLFRHETELLTRNADSPDF